MRCPRRFESPHGNQPGEDIFNPTCSWCGSISPEKLFEAISLNVELTPTDKSYKLYVGSSKFYFPHLETNEQRDRFVKYMNTGILKLAYPGHFYVLPFFVKVIAKGLQ